MNSPCHAAGIVLVRIMDGAKSQPPQPFKPAGFRVWVGAEQVMQALSGLEMVRMD